MSKGKKWKIEFTGPILDGVVTSGLMAKCGQTNCRCKKDPAALHGPYYRWMGNINGKRTTRTISKEVADECSRRIKNYEKLRRIIAEHLEDAIDSAPWVHRVDR